MENKLRVRSLQTMVDGMPLVSWVVDEDEIAILGDKEVEFVDPATIKIESKAIPTTMDVMVKMVAAQELEKAVAGRKDMFLYLFYQRRANAHPLFSVMVETESKVVVIGKKASGEPPSP